MRNASRCVVLFVACAALLFAEPAFAQQFSQQGPPLVGSGAVGTAYQGTSVAVSADGNTALVGGGGDNNYVGAAWVWTRSSGAWAQQGPKLVGSGAAGAPYPGGAGSYQGYSVALSADGNTALVGGYGDNGLAGAVWVWTRAGGVWTQQGPKLVGSGAAGGAYQGRSVALSVDGNTALVGGYGDNGFAGAVWVWTRSGGVWTQQGPKLVGSGAVGAAWQGYSVALSADGNTALVGGYFDDSSSGVGAVWVWTRSGGVWTQQGPKLVGSGAVGRAWQGVSVALSADGNTALVGGPHDIPPGSAGPQSAKGATWVWTRSGGVWTQQGPKLVFSPESDYFRQQGGSVALSADGSTALIGGAGHNLVWLRSGSVWTAQSFLPNTAVPGLTGTDALALSADGNTAVVGSIHTNSGQGTMWVFVTAPTFTTQPTNRTIRVGQSAHFTVAASGSPAPSYQWQVSGNSGASWNNLHDLAPYAGTTTASLVVMSASTALNGLQFRVVATSIGSATSSVATLTVHSGAAVIGDFDRDGKTDIGVFRPSNGTWYVRYAATGTGLTYLWGGAGDIPTAGDYDGDGLADMAVFRPATGTWYVRYTATGAGITLVWGGAADVPVPGDYDGDGRTDIAVFRPSNGTWYVRYAATGTGITLVWGGIGDVPAVGDYDGDWRMDIAVFRPSTGTWYVRYTATGTGITLVWGGMGDVAVPGDYDGDGRTDIAIFRVSTGTWFVRYAVTGLGVSLAWGGGSDVPAPGDYDGDGFTDIAIFRPSTGTWFLRYSATGAGTSFVWGGTGDVAVLGR